MNKRKATDDVQGRTEPTRKRQKHCPKIDTTIATTSIINFNTAKALRSHQAVLRSKRADLTNLQIIQSELKKLSADRGRLGKNAVNNLIEKSQRQVKINEIIVADLGDPANNSIYRNLPSHLNQVAVRTLETYASENPRRRVDEFSQEVTTAVIDTALLKGDTDVVAQFDKGKAKCNTTDAIDGLLGRLEDSSTVGTFHTQIYSSILQMMKKSSSRPAEDFIKEVTAVIDVALNTAPRANAQPQAEEPDTTQLTESTPSHSSDRTSPSDRRSSASDGVSQSFNSVDDEDYREVSPLDEEMARLAGTTRSGKRRSEAVKPASTQNPDKATTALTPPTPTNRTPELMYTKRPHLKTKTLQVPKKG